MVAFVPHMLVINAEVPANNLKEFVAWVKANPGKVSYASAGPGTPHHIAGEMFKSMAGVDMLQVPYKGTGPASRSTCSPTACSSCRWKPWRRCRT